MGDIKNQVGEEESWCSLIGESVRSVNSEVLQYEVWVLRTFMLLYKRKDSDLSLCNGQNTDLQLQRHVVVANSSKFGKEKSSGTKQIIKEE